MSSRRTFASAQNSRNVDQYLSTTWVNNQKIVIGIILKLLVIFGF